MSPIESATPQLLDLAAAVRPEWDRDRLAGAIGAVRAAGWSWQRILTETVRLMTDEDGDPAALVDATRNPISRRPAIADPALAEINRRGVAAARAALGGDR